MRRLAFSCGGGFVVDQQHRALLVAYVDFAFDDGDLCFLFIDAHVKFGAFDQRVQVRRFDYEGLRGSGDDVDRALN